MVKVKIAKMLYISPNITVRSHYSSQARTKHTLRRLLTPFTLGFTIGFLFCFFMLRIQEHERYSYTEENLETILEGMEYPASMDQFSNALFSNNTKGFTVNEIKNHSRILCWVMIMEYSTIINRNHIRETWGQRCDILLFMTVGEEETQYTANVVQLNTSTTIFQSPTDWQKTKDAWLYVYENYINEADWFVAVKWDSYVIMENLRHFLRNFQTESLVYFGYAYKSYSFSYPYISSTPAYVLSKATLKIFSETILKTEIIEWNFFQSESTILGKHLRNIGVKAVDARDRISRLLFVPDYLVEQLLMSKSFANFYKDENWNPVQSGLLCCSDLLIAFRAGEKTDDLLKFEYTLNQLRPYGVNQSQGI